MIEETELSLTAELYAQIVLVLDSREAISTTRDRLTAYFTAKGVAVTQPSAGSSNIFIGDTLCS